MQKVFYNGNENDNRQIMISISNNFIEFFFYDDYVRQRNWIKEQIERRLENGEDDLSNEEKQINSFYWIDAQHWNKDKTERLDREDNWHKHMMQKRWFTSEMKDFINANTSQ